MLTVCDVNVNGKPLGGRVDAIDVVQALAEPLQIRCRLAMDLAPADLPRFFRQLLGARLEVSFRRPEGGATPHTGNVAAVDVNDAGVVEILALGGLNQLDGASRCAAFAEQTVAGVIGALLNASGQPHIVDAPPAGAPAHPFLSQYQQTDLQFLRRLCVLDGYMLYDGRSGIEVRRAPHGDTVALTWTDLVEGSSRVRVAPQPVARSAVRHTYHPKAQLKAAVQSPAYEPMPNLAAQAHAAATALFPSPGMLPDLMANTKQEMNAQLEASARSAGLATVTYGMTVLRPAVRVGSCIRAPQGHIASETLLVTGTSATWSAGAYECKVRAVPSAMASGAGAASAAGPSQGAGVWSATVTDNRDPNRLGRVRVQSAWDAVSTWARVATAAAGAGGATAWTPGVGDEVLCAFEFGDPSRPVIVGSLYHADAPPPFITENGIDDVVVAKTARGTEVRIVDTQGSEEFFIRMKGGQNELRLTLAEGGRVDIKAQAECCVQAKKIHLRADEEVVIEAGTSIKLKGKADVTVQGGIIRLN